MLTLSYEYPVTISILIIDFPIENNTFEAAPNKH